MFDLPLPPDTLITRQLTCISCKEVFTIAEGDSQGKQVMYPQLPADYLDTIGLPYQPDIMWRPPAQEVLSHSHLDFDKGISVTCPRCGTDNRNWLRLMTYSSGSGFFARLKLWLRRFPLAGVGLCLSMLLLSVAFVRHFLLKQPLVPDSNGLALVLLLAILVSGVVPVTFIPEQWSRLREYRLLRGFVPEHSLVDRISPPVRTGLYPIFLSVLLLPLLLFALIPWVIDAAPDLLLPPEKPGLTERIDTLLADLDKVLENLSENNERPVRAAVGTLQNVLNNNMYSCNSSSVPTMITALEKMRRPGTVEVGAIFVDNALDSLQKLQAAGPECRLELIVVAHSSLTALQKATILAGPEADSPITPSCQPTNNEGRAYQTECVNMLLSGMIKLLDEMKEPETVTGSLQQQVEKSLYETRQLLKTPVNDSTLKVIDHEVSVLEQFVVTGQTETPQNPGKAFFKAWLKYVGISSTLAVIFSLMAVNNYVQRIDSLLPRPLCHSVADLAHVAIWEARRSLAIPADQVRDIQWVSAQRNERGGVYLMGLHRDIPEADGNRKAGADRVRAQCYRIHTDAWGRIQTVEVKDVRVPRQVRSSSYLPVHNGVLRHSQPLRLGEPRQTYASG